MAGKTTPWWRDVLTRAVRGIRAGVAAFFRPGKKPADPPAGSPNQEIIPEEEAALSDHSPQSSSELSHASAIEKPQPAPEVPGGAAATEDVPSDAPVREERAAQPETEDAVAPQPAGGDAAEEASRAEEGAGEAPESPADLLAEAALGLNAGVEEAASAPERKERQPQILPSVQDDRVAEDVFRAEAAAQAETPAEPELNSVPEGESKPIEAVAPIDERVADDVPESPADLLAEAALGMDVGAAAATVEPEPAAQPEVESEELEAVMPDQPTEDQAGHEEGINLPAEQEQQEAAAEEAPGIPVEPEPEATRIPEKAVQTEAQQPQSATLPPQAAATAPQVLHEAIKREQGPDTSPVSVFVNQVYEGPFDLLLDLIRKQDIDIYDIPIAKITAQFLAYVNQLKASDMDVAGEFIYTASLLIHIKSKMLLPREPKGGDEGQEDPRRELVERLLEHERFKNAAQMLQQKQMLEAATWTNPGVREFRESAGESEIGPEIAADTTDLVRVFRTILERARNRPVINVQEDSVTVGQMIQFLARRLTMEDKPVALHRLLAHTKSERALIAMFLALLELVRLQAILLRQDRQFSEIFIKKNSGFETAMNQGMARDDWQ